MDWKKIKLVPFSDKCLTRKDLNSRLSLNMFILVDIFTMSGSFLYSSTTLFEKNSLLTSNLAGGLDRQQGLVPPVTPGGCPSLSGLIPLEDEAVGWVHSILASQDPPNLNQVSYFPSSLQGCLF